MPSVRARSTRRGTYDRTKTADERQQEQRRRLVRAATEEFARRGFANTTVAHIVERARVSKQTFYAHFDDLRDALVKVYEDANGRLIRHVAAGARPAPGADPIDRLRTAITAYLTSLAANASLSRVLDREIMALGPEQASRRERTIEAFAKLLHEGAVEAHERGLSSKQPCELTAYMLVSAMAAVALRYVDRDEQDHILDAVPEMIDLVVRAYA